MIYPPARPLPEIEVVNTSGFSTEDVFISQNGSVFTGLRDGRILNIEPDGTERVVGNTRGWPLGIEQLPDGRLVICDCRRGLLAMSLTTGKIDILAENYLGEPLSFCNNAAVAQDGTVYFSTSSKRYPLEIADRDVIEGIPTGRLFRRDPNGALTLLKDDLYLANGVMLPLDERFVLIAETGAARIQRLWLTGEKAGQWDMFADDLPYLPDNLTVSIDGTIWVGMIADNDAMFKLVQKLPLGVRRFVARLPEKIRPKRTQYIMVMAFNEDGECTHHFRGKHPEFRYVSGVRERHGVVWMGSTESNCITRFKITSDELERAA